MPTIGIDLSGWSIGVFNAGGGGGGWGAFVRGGRSRGTSVLTGGGWGEGGPGRGGGQKGQLPLNINNTPFSALFSYFSKLQGFEQIFSHRFSF